jgi:hypothetical protein
LGLWQEQTTISYQVYLARWAKRLSWKETADIFKTSWDSIFRSVSFVVDYGLAHRTPGNWVTRTLQTDLEQMKKVARMLKNH